MRTLSLAVFAFSVAALVGCGESLPKTHEGCLDEMQKVVDEAGGILDKIQTKDDVAKYKSDLEKLAKRAQALADQVKKLDKPSESDKEKLMGKGMKLVSSAMSMQQKLAKLPADVRAEIEKFDFKMK